MVLPAIQECKKCHQIKPANQYHKASTGGNKGTRIRSICKNCALIRDQQWKKDNPERAKGYFRKANLKARANITVEQYEKLLVSQNGVCAICGNQDKTFPLSIDHDHSCCPGANSCGLCIRGLLCGCCNRAIGLMYENPETLMAAINYLERKP